jgi:hypothetical protein
MALIAAFSPGQSPPPVQTPNLTGFSPGSYQLQILFLLRAPGVLGILVDQGY